MSQPKSSPAYMRTQEQDEPSLRYTAFIDKITAPGGPRHLQKFAALRNFLYLDGYAQHGIPRCAGKPIITVAAFRPLTAELEFHNVETHDLGSIIDHDIPQLFLVENITPDLVKVLGGHLGIDPQFFLDYIDAIPGGFNITKEEEATRPDIVPTPWYRLQNLEGHLPMLCSSKAECEHIQMRFVGPRQCNKANNRNAKERMRPNLQKMNVERVAGLQIPIARDTGVDGRQFDNVAMTRQCASIWFKTPAHPKRPEWLKGVVLLDPPFEVDHTGQKEYGEMMPSMHQTCVSPLAPLDLSEKDLLDGRSSYRDSLVHYLQHSLNLQARSDFHPLLVVRGVARIVASEWIVTNAHVERDINTIEWQLETMSTAVADVGMLRKVLSRLFTHRRRIGKYQALIEEQRELLAQGGDSRMPAAWLLKGRRLPRAARQAWREMQSDANQVHDMVTRNAERVAQLVELLMSIMSVQEAGLSVKQNETLTFLALVATFALPFNAVAAVLAIQTRFGPEGESFWVFWVASLSTWGLIWSIYLLYPQVRRRRVTREV